MVAEPMAAWIISVLSTRQKIQYKSLYLKVKIMFLMLLKVV